MCSNCCLGVLLSPTGQPGLPLHHPGVNVGCSLQPGGAGLRGLQGSGELKGAGLVKGALWRGARQEWTSKKDQAT